MAQTYPLLGGTLPLPSSVRAAVVEAFWPSTHHELENFESFFRYLEYVLHQLNEYPWSKSRSLAVKSIGEVCLIVDELRQKRHKPRKDLVQDLQTQYFPHALAEEVALSLEMSAHLALSLNVQCTGNRLPLLDSGASTTPWAEDKCLDEIVSHSFPSRRLQQAVPTLIDPQFTAANFFKMAAIRVKWTSNLSDHLHFDVLHRTVHIYAHKACLLAHLENPDSILPSSVIQATLSTMDLLFPYGDAKTQRFLARHKQPIHRIYSPASSAPSTWQAFGVWEGRLTELYSAYNAPRVGYRQLRYDERNPMQWWTFWLASIIALLTIIFGSISTVTSLEQTRLARLSYELALAQNRDG